MVLDGIEVADYVRGKLGKKKVILVGLSWGSMLGVRMVKSRPDLFYAYVGTGQSVSYLKGKIQAYAQLLAEARARGNHQAIQELEGIGPPPHDSTEKAGTHTRWANRYEPGIPSNWSAAATVLFDSPVGVSDLRNLMAGIRTSEDHFRREIEAGDLPAFGTDFAIPMFFFQGAQDNVAPAAQVQAYVESMTAPQKRLVLIPNAGHNAIATRSAEFLRLLRELVRPLAQ